MRTKYHLIEEYMQTCMKDSAHDIEHIYRVLSYSLNIAKHESDVDIDILTVAALLHDIGREEQYTNPGIDHALYGADKAYNFLMANGYSEDYSSAVKHCIETHRFRSNNPPKSIEAKILFDADKLDACGVVGIARVLLAKASVGEPLYSIGKEGNVLDGSSDTQPSFLHEYKFKLEKLYSRFYTKHGMELAMERKYAAEHFYDSLLAELKKCYSHSQSTNKHTQSEG